MEEIELKYLTEDQILNIIEEFKMPFNGIEIVIESVNEQIQKIARSYLENIKIYEGMLEEYKRHLKNKFLSTLIEAGTPIGAITSDAIGQQATQALLNTFHSIGTLKSGGPDGIKENIGISNNRKNLYSMIHMKNTKMSFSDVMNLKKKFIGLSISDLLIGTPESIFVNVKKEIEQNPFKNESLEERKKITTGKSFWWYCITDTSSIYDKEQNLSSKRSCLRLKFDIQKLYENQILIFELAQYLNNLKEPFKKPKVDITEKILAIPSPTNIGVIDLFVKCLDSSKDYLLISLIHDNKFKNLIINGVDGILNFYPVSTPVIRLIRDIEETSRFDEENNKKGMWIYLNDNRFNGIPYSRVLNLLEESGLKYEIPYFKPDSNFNKDYVDLPFDFFSHKIIQELRSSFKLRGYLLFNNNNYHEHPYYYYHDGNEVIKKPVDIKHYNYNEINRGFEVAILFESHSNDAGNSISTKKFKNKEEVLKFVVSLENKLNKSQFNSLFNNDESSNDFFENENNGFFRISFEIDDNDEISKFVNFHFFQIKYIDYQIDVNLDYVNSQFITQSLDSVLLLHFAIPYQNGVSLPDSIRKYKIFDVKKVEQFERKIFLKSKMFLSDRYDFLNKPNRKLSIEYFRRFSKEMTFNDKLSVLIDLCNEHGIQINEASVKYFKDKKLDETNNDAQVKYFDSLINGSKLTPLERFFIFLKEHTKEENNNYVYVETNGSNFAEIIVNPLIKGNKTICNNFYQIYNYLGIEALRNTLDYDLINMINNSGYISVEYMNLLTNVTTHNGINPMTSEGISCQGRDYLAMASFDNAPKYIRNAALLGEEHSTESVSTCIFLGKNFKLGTGFAKVSFDKTKLNFSNNKEGISYGFLKLTGIKKSSDRLSITNKENDDEEEIIYVPELVPYKFPRVIWIMDNFIQMDLYHYIQAGINKLRNSKFKMISIKNCSNCRNDRNITMKKISPGSLPKI